jgi:protein involved in polysaccharide export with SLBB domain
MLSRCCGLVCLAFLRNNLRGLCLVVVSFGITAQAAAQPASQNQSSGVGAQSAPLVIEEQRAQLPNSAKAAVEDTPLAPELAEFLSTYKLGSGDVLAVRVFGEPDLSADNLRLSDTGTIFLPTIGELRVGGFTLGEVERRVTDRLKGRILMNPRVSVSVVQYRSFFVSGMVRNPGAFPYQPGLTVRKAAALAGGLQERASLKKIFVIRGDDPKMKPERVGLDTRIFPGDVITIEESFF